MTTQFSGLVMSYDDEQEESFLTTQQVDEARHMQFFDRYYREVFGFEEAGITTGSPACASSSPTVHQALRRVAGGGRAAADRRTRATVPRRSTSSRCTT